MVLVGAVLTRTIIIKDMWYFSGKGDDGEANLLDDKRLPKSAPIFELIGALDEATAHIGLAISFCTDKELIQVLRLIQDDLSKFMGIIVGAGKPDTSARFDLDEKIEWIENCMNQYGSNLINPKSFNFPGATKCGSAMDISRTVIRKAERLYTQLFIDSKGPKEYQAFLNRLSSLLYVLRLHVDNQVNFSPD